MKKTISIGMTALLSLVLGIASAGDEPGELGFPKPTPEHAWLQQLVGEWEAEGECWMEPGKPPTKSKGRDTVRAIGGFWAQATFEGDFVGQPFTGVMTLGYDPEQKRYIASWTDSMTPMLWQYTGKVEGNVLTLETEGTCPGDGKLSKFRERIEILSKDRRTLTSEREVDGKWVTCVKFTFTRKK